MERLSEEDMERAFRAFKEGVAGRGYMDRGPAMDGLRAALEALVPAHTERAWNEGKREGELLAYNAVLAQHAIDRRAYANERRRLRDSRPDLFANPYSTPNSYDLVLADYLAGRFGPPNPEVESVLRSRSTLNPGP